MSSAATGKGAALVAKQAHGAIYGKPEGLQGQSYAIITKELRPDFPPVTLQQVADGISRFLAFADATPHLAYYVTPIGCGLAGFTVNQIAPLFRLRPSNVALNPLFLSYLTETQQCLPSSTASPSLNDS